MWLFTRAIIIFVIIFLSQFYFGKKLLNSLRTLFPSLDIKSIKKYLIVTLGVLNLYPVLGLGIWIYTIVTNTTGIRPPENEFINFLVIYPFWILMLFLIQHLMFIIPLDVSKFLLYPLYKKRKDKLRVIEAKIVLVIMIAFALYVPGRVIFDRTVVLVRNTEYVKENLPVDLDGLRIALISDVQADTYTKGSRLDNFIDKVNESKPDLILIAGDVITGSPKYINTAAESLGKLNAPYGIYSCVGDHDNWAYRTDNNRSLREITEALAKYNVPMVHNENKFINIGDSKIGISFITYTYSRRIPESLLDSLTNGLNGEDFKIFLTHQPRQHLIDKAVDKNYDMLFAGHTHGGQITFLFPFFNPSVTHLETNYVKGDFWFGDMLMVVTRGLGMSLAPVRYNSTPEVTIITLKNKPSQIASAKR